MEEQKWIFKTIKTLAEKCDATKAERLKIKTLQTETIGGLIERGHCRVKLNSIKTVLARIKLAKQLYTAGQLKTL